jgi:hypothetical protein
MKETYESAAQYIQDLFLIYGNETDIELIIEYLQKTFDLKESK